MREAGITGYKYIDWFRIMRRKRPWPLTGPDQTHQGNGHVDWYLFDQRGPLVQGTRRVEPLPEGRSVIPPAPGWSGKSANFQTG